MSLSCLRCVLLDLRSRGWGVERRTRPDQAEQKLIDAEMDGVGGAETCQLCCGRMDRDSEGSFFPLQLPSHSSLLLFFLLSSGPHVLVHHSFLGSSVTLCYHLPGRGGTQVFLFCFAPKLTSLFIIRPCLVSHSKIFYPSHRIFEHMYGTLNVDKKIN
jgi:hypothetical protein